VTSAPRLLNWLFRNRRTGAITIVQFPNLALAIFMAASVARAVTHPNGAGRTALTVIASFGLIWWAVDEMARGVNPWRRFFGAAVLAGQLLRLAR
jgi:hypothetical protein